MECACLLSSIPVSSTVVKQSLFDGCLLPGPRRFLRGSACCSALVALDHLFDKRLTMLRFKS